MWAAFKALGWGGKALVLAAILAILASCYYVGLDRGKNISKVEIAKYEGKIKTLEAERNAAQAKIDVRYVTQYKDRIQYVDRVVTKTRTVVEQSVPEQFTLSKGWIYAYNQSVRGLDVDPAKASDATPSTVTEMRALADTIVPNNGVFLSNKAQLESLQDWIRATNEEARKINEGRSTR